MRFIVGAIAALFGDGTPANRPDPPEGHALQPGGRCRSVRGRDGRHPLGDGEKWVAHSAVLVLVVILALAFDYINGFHDTANAVATVVSTNVLPGRTAVILAAVCNFVGAFAGVGVAKTIGGDIAAPTSITQLVVAAALLGAIAWNLLTWYFGIPSSSSHALIGGVVGAVWCYRVLGGDPAGEAIWGLADLEGRGADAEGTRPVAAVWVLSAASS